MVSLCGGSEPNSFSSIVTWSLNHMNMGGIKTSNISSFQKFMYDENATTITVNIFYRLIHRTVSVIYCLIVISVIYSHHTYSKYTHTHMQTNTALLYLKILFLSLCSMGSIWKYQYFRLTNTPSKCPSTLLCDSMLGAFCIVWDNVFCRVGQLVSQASL